jgi:hypothetical protein
LCFDAAKMSASAGGASDGEKKEEKHVKKKKRIESTERVQNKSGDSRTKKKKGLVIT